MNDVKEIILTERRLNSFFEEEWGFWIENITIFHEYKYNEFSVTSKLTKTGYNLEGFS